MWDLDKRFYDMVFAESGGGVPEEIIATAAAYMNRADSVGYEKALRASNAYRKKSRQYKLAEKNDLNPFERRVYDRNKQIIDELYARPETRPNFYFHENVNAYGNPPWINETSSSVDIGNQRFYTRR